MIDFHSLVADTDRERALVGAEHIALDAVYRAKHRSNPDQIHKRVIGKCPYCPWWANTEAQRIQMGRLQDQVRGLLAQADDEDLS